MFGSRPIRPRTITYTIASFISSIRTYRNSNFFRWNLYERTREIYILSDNL